MDFNEQWIPVISEGVKWVKDKLCGPSKKELKIKVSDLEAQVKTLIYGNAILINSMKQIVIEILNQLVNVGYKIDANTIILVNDNHGQLSIGYNSNQSANPDLISSMFDDVDKEIAQSRLFRPSERRDNHDNP